MGNYILFSLMAGLATSIGSILVLITGKPNRKKVALFLGLAAGIMLGVIFLDLLPSALMFGSMNKVLFGFWLGLIFTFICDKSIAWVFKKTVCTEGTARFLQLGVLVTLGIAIHDFPEGIAIAAGFSAQQKLGLTLALAIGLHNIPEGMATTTPLQMGGLKSLNIIVLMALLSLITPLGTIAGFYLVHLSKVLIPLLLALAAGTMSYLVISEILPESRRQGHFRSIMGAILGVGIMVLVKWLE